MIVFVDKSIIFVCNSESRKDFLITFVKKFLIWQKLE